MKNFKLFFFLLLASFVVNAQGSKYEITFNYKSESFHFFCSDDQTIFDAAKKNGIIFDFLYDAGATNISRAQLITGDVDNTSQTFLNDQELEESNILLTAAYPKSDCEISKDLIAVKSCKIRLASASPTFGGAPIAGGGMHIEIKAKTNDYFIYVRARALQWFTGGISVFVDYPCTAEPLCVALGYSAAFPGAWVRIVNGLSDPYDDSTFWRFLINNNTQADCFFDMAETPQN